MITKREIEDTGHGAASLAKLANHLGYKGVADQLQFPNGFFASDLIAFFEDNPGACEAVVNWVLEEGLTADGEEIPESHEEEEEED